MSWAEYGVVAHNRYQKLDLIWINYMSSVAFKCFSSQHVNDNYGNAPKGGIISGKKNDVLLGYYRWYTAL